jgi:hypothetical protein
VIEKIPKEPITIAVLSSHYPYLFKANIEFWLHGKAAKIVVNMGINKMY